MAQKKSEPTIATHSGTFHCDEVLACFMLRQLPEYKNAKIFRSRDIQKLNEESDIIVDVGNKFDHEQKLYDHHQQTFKETFSTLRPDLDTDFNTRLSSAGLIYVYYGERIIQSILEKQRNIKLSDENLAIVYLKIYCNFINEIDAIDNGVPLFKGVEPDYKVHTDLSSRIRKLNPGWDEEGVDIEQRFEKAMDVAGQEFIENVIRISCSWLKARDLVRAALKKSKEIYPTGEIIYLDILCPWKVHLFDLEKELNIEGLVKLVIYNDGTSFRIAGVPITPGSYEGRKFLPEMWRGLRDEELCKIANIENLIFVHHNGFIGGTCTKEAALAMAIKSVEWPNEEEGRNKN